MLSSAVVRASAMELKALPEGVELHPIAARDDERGVFREIYRQSWSHQAPAVQWNLVASTSNVLRGVHAHVRHVDYLMMAAGKMILGLHDARRHSSTYGRSLLCLLDAEDPQLVVVPPGVCHGFYFPEPGLQLHGVSVGWDNTDEFECAWNAPELKLAWPCEAPVLSPRDAQAGSYDQLCAALQAHGVA